MECVFGRRIVRLEQQAKMTSSKLGNADRPDKWHHETVILVEEITNQEIALVTYSVTAGRRSSVFPVENEKLPFPIASAVYYCIRSCSISK